MLYHGTESLAESHLEPPPSTSDPISRQSYLPLLTYCILGFVCSEGGLQASLQAVILPLSITPG